MHNIELVCEDGFTKTIIIYPLISPYHYVIRCSYNVRYRALLPSISSVSSLNLTQLADG